MSVLRASLCWAASKARGTDIGAHGKVLADQRKAEALDRLAPVVERLSALKAASLAVWGFADRLNPGAWYRRLAGRGSLESVHRSLGDRMKGRIVFAFFWSWAFFAGPLKSPPPSP